MALIKCKECGSEISSTAKSCPHCGYKNDNKVCPECGSDVGTKEKVCSSCGFPLQKKNTQNIISDNLDKITGAKSENYVTFKDLFKDSFKKHTDEELDEVFICGGKTTTPKVSEIDPHNCVYTNKNRVHCLWKFKLFTSYDYARRICSPINCTYVLF